MCKKKTFVFGDGFLGDSVIVEKRFCEGVSCGCVLRVLNGMSNNESRISG